MREKLVKKIIDSIKKNKVISLITDAGTPTISDPGMILVNKCIEENLSVYPILVPLQRHQQLAFLDLVISIYFMVF